MRIAVLVKHVPEPTASWRFAGDLTLDRAGVEGRLSQLDEYAVEQALRLAGNGTGAEITCLTMGPAGAADGLRKALAMGGHNGVHVHDDALHGSDAVGTSLVLARALQRIGFDLVVCGMASTDAELSVIPGMIAERLGVPHAGHACELRIDGTVLAARRETGTAVEEVTVDLPAVVSVTDQSGEPRYPTFKNIMAARKKPVRVLSLADLEIDPSEVGLAGAGTVTESVQPRPARTAGTIVADEGDAAARLADFLVAGKFL
jgi:electron transfer flavoprotein beta subunit